MHLIIQPKRCLLTPDHFFQCLCHEDNVALGSDVTHLFYKFWFRAMQVCYYYGICLSSNSAFTNQHFATQSRPIIAKLISKGPLEIYISGQKYLNDWGFHVADQLLFLMQTLVCSIGTLKWLGSCYYVSALKGPSSILPLTSPYVSGDIVVRSSECLILSTDTGAFMEELKVFARRSLSVFLSSTCSESTTWGGI